jgi:multiple sugar transport system permease protein
MTVRQQAISSAQARVSTTPERRTNWKVIGRYIAMAVVLIVALGPFYWTLITSVKSDAEINASPPTLIPHSFTAKNYAEAFSSVQPAFAKDLLNSTIVAISTTILALIFGSIAAYAISRLKFKGKAAALGIILSVQMFPLIALVGPLYVFFTGPFNVYNTYIALIIPYLVISLPITIFFLTSFFRDLPPDLEEAAFVDGTTRLSLPRRFFRSSMSGTTSSLV